MLHFWRHRLPTAPKGKPQLEWCIDMSCLSRDTAHAVLAPVKWGVIYNISIQSKLQDSEFSNGYENSQEAKHSRGHSIEPLDKNKPLTVTLTFPH